MRKSNLKQICFVISILVGTLYLSGCTKFGLNESLPGIDRIIVEDAQNANNKVASIVVKDGSGNIIPNYFLHFNQDPSISTPSSVTDTMFVSLATGVDYNNLRMVLTLSLQSMSATIKDTNKVRIFEPLSEAYSVIVSGRSRTYTLVDKEGIDVTFSNGYKRKYVIFLELLDYVPPRIFNVGSFSGGMDSIGYDDVNAIITLYRSPFNTNLQQTLGYQIEPSDAIVDPQYVSGAMFDFGTRQTIRVPISVKKSDGTTFTSEYTIRLNLGYHKYTEVLKKVGDNRDNANFPASDLTTYNEEMAIAVNDKYVYVLRLKSTSATSALTYTAYREGQIFAYSLTDRTATPIALSMPPNQGLGLDSFPPISDIVISGNKLIGTGFAQRPGGRRGATNTSKVFFVSWDANAPSDYTIGDSVEMTLYSNVRGAGNPTMIKGSIEGSVDQSQGAYFYSFHTGAFFYLTTAAAPIFYPAGKRIKLMSDAGGAIRVAPQGTGLDTTNYYFSLGAASAPAGLSGKLAINHIPTSEGGGAILSSGGVTFYTKSIQQGEVSSDPTNAPSSIYFYNTGKIANVLGGTTADNELNGMVYFNYGNKNYMASTEWIRGASSRNNGISIFDIGSPVFDDKPSTISSTTYIQSKRVDRILIQTSRTSTAQHRGGIALYKLSNGKVRLASLIPGVGFGVYDIQ